MKTAIKKALGFGRKAHGDVPHPDSAWSPASLQERFPEIESEIVDIISSVQHTTMTSPERVLAFCDAVRHVTQNKIPGDIVECGVWRGGSMSAAAQMLVSLNSTERSLWLYDTFDGMSAPTGADQDFLGRPAAAMLENQDPDDAKSIWCKSGLAEVRETMRASLYPLDRTRFIEGTVETTLPVTRPEQIAVLRLDTDWYESTKCELEELFPRLATGGVLIIDDFGHWNGCRQAVEDYFATHKINMFLHRIDYTGRIGVVQPKPETDTATTDRQGE